MTRNALLVTVAALAATPLAAQHDHQAPPPPPRAAAQPAPAPSAPSPMGMPGGMGMMMPGMASMMGPLHAVMAYAPRSLLERKAALRLDSDQESRLAGIAAVSQAAHDTAHATAEHHRRALLEAAGAAPDPATVTAHFEAMHAAMGAAHAAMLHAALESRAVLTAGQRGLVDAPGHDAGMHQQAAPARTGQPGHEGHHAPRRP